MSRLPVIGLIFLLLCLPLLGCAGSGPSPTPSPTPSLSGGILVTFDVNGETYRMAEVTIELCDGIPSHVEANLNYWVDTVGRFCPWNAGIVDIHDFR
jgi:hypothetical protein